MDESWIGNYIPAGCLDIPSDTPDLPPEIWMLAVSQGWLFFTRMHDQSTPEPSRSDPKLRLSLTFQQALLRTPILQPFHRLWKKKWIELSFCTIKGPAGIIGRVRVYLLPHDTTRAVLMGPKIAS